MWFIKAKKSYLDHFRKTNKPKKKAVKIYFKL